jgi:hypothetical protein
MSGIRTEEDEMRWGRRRSHLVYIIKINLVRNGTGMILDVYGMIPRNNHWKEDNRCM